MQKLFIKSANTIHIKMYTHYAVHDTREKQYNYLYYTVQKRGNKTSSLAIDKQEKGQVCKAYLYKVAPPLPPSTLQSMGLYLTQWEGVTNAKNPPAPL